ncbi:hypothetical protein ALC60_06572 [Trachymyrmex zeteki]|uniref:Uncharacterized protein n=1 Tax=Mycetomoellerius zeteki TaxID=64791 RepID=A0A151X2R7_9HYME|nr:hypothetical protein ALC60_06572 [Trachymyrmex zeteki]
MAPMFLKQEYFKDNIGLDLPSGTSGFSTSSNSSVSRRSLKTTSASSRLFSFNSSRALLYSVNAICSWKKLFHILAKIVRNSCHLATHVKTYNETLLGCILFITSRIYSYSCNGCFAYVLSGNQTGGAIATNGVSRPKCSLPLPNTALM